MPKLLVFVHEEALTAYEEPRITELVSNSVLQEVSKLLMSGNSSIVEGFLSKPDTEVHYFADAEFKYLSDSLSKSGIKTTSTVDGYMLLTSVLFSIDIEKVSTILKKLY